MRLHLHRSRMHEGSQSAKRSRARHRCRRHFAPLGALSFGRVLAVRRKLGRFNRCIALVSSGARVLFWPAAPASLKHTKRTANAHFDATQRRTAIRLCIQSRDRSRALGARVQAVLAHTQPHISARATASPFFARARTQPNTRTDRSRCATRASGMISG